MGLEAVGVEEIPEVGPTDPEDAEDSPYALNRGALLSALDAADIVAVHTCLRRQFLLREATF